MLLVATARKIPLSNLSFTLIIAFLGLHVLAARFVYTFTPYNEWVRWLTGFDVPFLDTMYIDKPVQRHSVIQTISRVNRKFENKEKGLVVACGSLIKFSAYSVTSCVMDSVRT